jgi:hypothetical protein
MTAHGSSRCYVYSGGKMKKIDSLLGNFTNLQNLIQYAETKNSLIIATTMVVIGIVPKPDIAIGLLGWVKLLGVLLIFSAMVISLFSMIPKTKILLNDVNNFKTYGNLYLFSEIAEIKNKDEFIKILKQEYFKGEEFNQQEIDIANQVYTLSRIANHKFKCFKYSIWLFSLGAIFTFISMIV